MSRSHNAATRAKNYRAIGGDGHFIKIGDRVETLDNETTGYVLEIRRYAGMGDKLLIDIGNGLTDLLAVQFFRRIQ